MAFSPRPESSAPVPASWVSRSLAAAGAVSLGPTPGAAMMAICQSGHLGPTAAQVNVVTHLHLLNLLQGLDGGVHVRSPRRNLPYTLKTIGWYPRARWLAAPADFFQWPIEVRDSSAKPVRRARRRWHVYYDYGPSLVLGEQDVVVPYGVSPQLIHTGRWQLKDSLRAVPRDIRLLFAGSCHASYYDKQEIITARFGKMTRHAVIGALRAGGGWFEVSGPSDLGRIHGSERPVLIDSARARIQPEAWLETIAAADFLLCPPGTIMPMSHNIIEALGVGTIPLTNYPDWFFPALENGRNCFVFRSAEELLARVEEIRGLPAARIESMRAACRDYYDRHLDPRAAVARMVAAPLKDLRLHVLDETYGHLPEGPGEHLD